MANSSFCEVTLSLNNKEKIEWIGDDYGTPLFMIPDKAEDRLKAIHSIDEVITFLQVCIDSDDSDYARRKYETNCAYFDQKLRAIKFDSLYELSFAYGDYDPSDGFPVGCCIGGSLNYNFKTAIANIQHEAPDDFVEEMIDIYRDLFNEGF